MKKVYHLGLLGLDIGYSRSPELFEEIFRREGLEGSTYRLIDRPEVEPFVSEVRRTDHWDGFNVTTPYKTAIIPYLDRLDPLAAAVGAVNCVTCREGLLTGYNTDVEGFAVSLREEVGERTLPSSALILGSGGASCAVRVALEQLGISSKTVSRSRGLTYDKLTQEQLAHTPLIVHATPLGSAKYPGAKPPLPYDALHPGQLLIDLTYEPEVTPFLAEGRAHGCRTANGLTMLRAQAEAAWCHFRDQRISEA
ncbi:MAG: shikimate dehydrogenase [Porphyromonas sp.]|uniref:shikimate dehydrogenase family protein n=1 Tax=Porphyromonas sp. TaxID=1924944 RepID=UPI002A91CE67|nr:shikimate dehydrogenase [Porphyromonas sp.]MDD7469360.1 shikimate dehydrogenase [Bacteroidales bacterium]MDY6102708.1 shikimate dehydrogenase [Porphyromonas sp.]